MYRARSHPEGHHYTNAAAFSTTIGNQNSNGNAIGGPINFPGYPVVGYQPLPGYSHIGMLHARRLPAYRLPLLLLLPAQRLLPTGWLRNSWLHEHAEWLHADWLPMGPSYQCLWSSIPTPLPRPGIQS